jgi:hypothetical protein
LATDCRNVLLIAVPASAMTLATEAFIRPVRSGGDIHVEGRATTDRVRMYESKIREALV